MEIKSQGQQTVTDTDELIRCERCAINKPRSEFRQVARPTICLECYAAKRKKSVGATATPVSKKKGNDDKDRANVWLSLKARAVLRVMALKHKSESAAMEYLLMNHLDHMDPREKAMVTYIL